MSATVDAIRRYCPGVESTPEVLFGGLRLHRDLDLKVDYCVPMTAEQERVWALNYRTHAPLPPSILMGKTATLKPKGRGTWSRLVSFSK